MKLRVFVDKESCGHIWLTDLEGLENRDISFILIKIGEEKIEFDICTLCGKISKLIRRGDTDDGKGE